ncbi:hypothetical protein Halha_1944 [Halobacteroides halobius DSM 5150]|uniref:Class IIb bacteriocin, lactobin A/cerein 7B family n=1 Tax=Halobacteroides halobius (strain ATCC 35273 / DSM 5150 / MD-1) TaxID=748449 RepID=L0K9A4_HALHC|nr:hypothetical protein [Halobacteroides halobius]AGB41852.1 hypothetical protein Halha_1944 [Halobacteroides halobius DSM 5150]
MEAIVNVGMVELSENDLMLIDGGVDWVKVGLTAGATVALSFVSIPLGIAGGLIMVGSDLIDGDY